MSLCAFVAPLYFLGVNVLGGVHILGGVNVAFPQNASAHEQVFLRWTHFIAGTTWLGLLYFFLLVNTPFLKELESGTRAKVYATLMPRAMWWFRWASVVTWLAGFRYFQILLKEEAFNAGRPMLMLHSLLIWLGVWLVAYFLIHGMLMGSAGPLGNGWLLGVLVAVVVSGAAWLVLSFLAGHEASNRTLSIAVGGGLGTIMFLNVWGMVWRCQKKLIAWNRALAEHGTPMPPEAATLARRAYLASRMNFWLSFPLLFFMAAASHYPFLSGK
ncbi:MAG: hypothetical protein GZ088_03020 [Acidipila sp.]|nr:hypothetical protein [Acidipila sp.]